MHHYSLLILLEQGQEGGCEEEVTQVVHAKLVLEAVLCLHLGACHDTCSAHSHR